jgi:hypothetical protein
MSHQQELQQAVYGPKKFRFYDPATGVTIVDDGHVRKKKEAPAVMGTLHPDAEGDLFASFSDASGTALQDIPILPDGSRDASRKLLGGNTYGLEGMDFSVDNVSAKSVSTTTDGPDVYGLRLENFDFDEANLFDGFKPIFDYPARAPHASGAAGAANANSLEELGVAAKSRPDAEMQQTVDLILS